MFERLRSAWRRFADAEPGTRFEKQYEAHQTGRRSRWMRPLTIVAGFAIIALGVVALPAPGPGWLVIGGGAALLAREFHFLARFLDSLEVKLRRLAGRLKKLWKKAPLAARIVVVAVGLGLASVAAVWTFRVTVGS